MVRFLLAYNNGEFFFFFFLGDKSIIIIRTDDLSIGLFHWKY